MISKNFFAKLKRRNVCKVAIADGRLPFDPFCDAEQNDPCF